jgi:hypothetical protein
VRNSSKLSCPCLQYVAPIWIDIGAFVGWELATSKHGTAVGAVLRRRRPSGKMKRVDRWIVVKRIGLDQGIGGVWTVDSTANAWDLVAHTSWVGEISAFRS